MKVKDAPLTIYLIFTFIYSIIGNPDDRIWSGAYFLVNYLMLMTLFNSVENKLNRSVGMAISISLLIFVISNYFFNFEYERYYNFIPFIISLFSFYK